MKSWIAARVQAGLSLLVSSTSPSHSEPDVMRSRGELLDRYVPDLLSEYKVAGAGVAIISKGVVIFINGGNGVLVSTQILGLIGIEPEIAAYYRQLVKKFYNRDLSPLQNQL